MNLLLNDSVTEQSKEGEFLDSITLVCEIQTNQFNRENLKVKHKYMVRWLMIAELEADLSNQEIVDEVLPQSETTDSYIEETVPAAQVLTVSCDDMLSAATTLLC